MRRGLLACQKSSLGHLASIGRKWQQGEGSARFLRPFPMKIFRKFFLLEKQKHIWYNRRVCK